MPDDLAGLARDLVALPRADRRAILSALELDERQRIEAAMRGGAAESREAAPLHSAWFDGLLVSEQVTLAARAALATNAHVGPVAEHNRVPGRTLIQAAGGLLARAGLRR